jgi:DNA polymerase IV
MVSGFRSMLAQSAYAGATAAGESSPARVVMLLDYDAFFARCMQQAYPPLRGKPIGIRGPAKGTCIIAASTEAKQHGVKVGMHITEATRCCPGFLGVRADMDMYNEICRRSLAVLTSYTDRVEPFSIDEAFLDVTDLHARHGGPVALAQRLKADLRAALGDYITCSIGIAPNKMLAKLVMEFHKPDGITCVTTEEVPAALEQVALRDICGIGPRIEQRLNRLGIYRLAQLARMPRELLVKEFGTHGHVYWLWGQGIDYAPVQPYHTQAAEKSIGHGMMLPEAVSRRSAFDAILLNLCDRVGRRLRRRSFLAGEVALWLRYDGREQREGIAGHVGFPQHTDLTHDLYAAVQRLLPAGGLPQPVRHVIVTAGKLRRNDAIQLSLLHDRLRERTLQQAMDAVNEHCGQRALVFAATLLDRTPVKMGPPGHALCKRFDVPDEAPHVA